MIATTTLLAGCANGDFGRVRPSLVGDDMHAWVGQEAAASIGGPASEYRLTDEERRLRDLAYPLIEPPYDRKRWYSVLGEYGVMRAFQRDGEPFERTAYWDSLATRFRRSEASSYALLIADTRNDETRLQPFFATAQRVIDMDNKRAQSLAHVSRLNVAEEQNALARNNENTAIVAWVCRSLQRRVAAYHYALERLAISVPAASAAEADRSVGLLRTRTAQFCGAVQRAA
jgi:hypothetical protein